MRNAVRWLAHRLLPRRVKPRKFHFGPLAGAVANVDFDYDTALYFGRHEPVLHPHYRALLRPGMRSFDVGMYRGWDALLMAHLTGGEVVSFDGNPKCLEMTADFLAPSGARVTLVHSFVGDDPPAQGTLDQAARDHFVPDFVKIDVEGAEVAVLNGASRLLADRRPSLIVEVHSAALEADCAARLEAHGYSPTAVERSRGLFTESRGLEYNRWLVCAGRPPA